MNRTSAPGSSGGQYVDDNPALGVIGTLVVAADKNAVQEELVQAIEGAGLTPSGSNIHQLLDALRKGSGSTYNADKLDSQEGSFYQNAGNLNAGTLPIARLSTDVMIVTAGPSSGTIINYVANVINYAPRCFGASGASVSGMPLTSGNWICWTEKAGGNTACTLYAADWDSSDSTIFQQIIVNGTGKGWTTSSGMNGLVQTADLDNFKKTGTWRFSSGGTLLHAPGGGSDFILTVSGNYIDLGYCAQTANYATSEAIWTRVCTAGGWGPWIRSLQVNPIEVVSASTTMAVVPIGDTHLIYNSSASPITITVSASSGMVVSCSRQPTQTGAYAGGQTFSLAANDVAICYRSS